jgi:hypothetical protein
MSNAYLYDHLQLNEIHHVRPALERVADHHEDIARAAVVDLREVTLAARQVGRAGECAREVGIIGYGGE